VSEEPRKGWAQACLRISSEAVSFESIADQLGLLADSGGNAGEPGPGRSTRRRTLWVLESGLPNDRHLDEHLHPLLGRLDSRHAALATLRSNCRMEIFAGAYFENGQIGETVPWQIMKALGDLQINLDLDLYSAGALETQTE
jgi:Domain of unknown function (DUF4279)